MDTLIKLPDIHQICSLHDTVMVATGGPSGVRSFDSLAGAWARAEGRKHFEEDATVTQLASTLAVSIVKAHGFVDGNKRAAYGALSLALSLNGMRITAAPEDVVAQVVKAAAGDGSTTDMEDWLASVAEPDPVYRALFDFDLNGPEVS